MKKETKLAYIIGLTVLLLVNLPFLVPILSKKEGLVFLGRHPVNSQDTYTYMAWIEQARQSQELKNLYTSESQSSAILRPSYQLIGKLAQIAGTSSVAAYHAARLILTGIFMAVFYRFLRHFFESERERLLAFALTLSSSGLGYLFGRLVPESIDLWVPEAITFMAMMEAPHFILSLILLLLGYTFILKFLEKRQGRTLIAVGFAFLLLALEHPFNLITAVPILVVWVFWETRSLLTAVGIGLLAGIGLLYQVWAVYANPILRAWEGQNTLLSPEPINYLIGFGLILPFVIIGGERMLRKASPGQKLSLIWIAVTALALYLPLNFQRRLIEGVQLPLAIAAAYGVLAIISRYKEKTRWALASLIVGALAVGNLVLIYREVQTVQAETKDSYYYHLSAPEWRAMHWLREETTSEDVILANWFNGNLIPGITGRTVYLGHKIQTVEFEKKVLEVDKFLLEEDAERAEAFLRENRISYIYLGIGDSMLTYGFTPETKAYLVPVYQEEGVQIYRVTAN